MAFKFSWSTSIICLVLACLMIRASFWQWDRHIQKLELIAELEKRLEIEPIPLTAALDSLNSEPENFSFRRLLVEGDFDFENEMILRNRRHDAVPGVFSITPLKIKNTDKVVLVSRGFIPLAYSAKEKRKNFNQETQTYFVGLVKPGSQAYWYSPKDSPTGQPHPWVDAWLRVDLKKMQAQLPYPILPVYLEMMDDSSLEEAKKKMLTSKSGKDDMFMPPIGDSVKIAQEIPQLDYPLPVNDIIIPAGRHLGYVYEWAFMAILTLAIGTILQLRRH